MADRRLAWALVAVIVRYLTTIQPQAHRELARWRRHALAIPIPSCARTSCVRSMRTGARLGAALFAVLAPFGSSAGSCGCSLPTCCCGATSTFAPSATRTPTRGCTTRLLTRCDRKSAPAGSCGGRRRIPHRTARRVPSRMRGAARVEIVQPAALRSPTTVARFRRSTTAHRRGRDAAARMGPSARTSLARAMRRRQQPTRDPCADGACRRNPAPALPKQRRPPRPTSPSPRSASFATTSSTTPKTTPLVNHSYLRYLGPPSPLRAGDLADRAARSVRQLPAGERHTVILAAMVAMFLSRPQASSGIEPDAARAILDALGPPAPQLNAGCRRVTSGLRAPDRGLRRAAPAPARQGREHRVYDIRVPRHRTGELTVGAAERVTKRSTGTSQKRYESLVVSDLASASSPAPTSTHCAAWSARSGR